MAVRARQNPHPVAAGVGLEMLVVAVVDEGVEIAVAHRVDAAAASAIAAPGSAIFDEFLAAKSDAAVAAIACGDRDFSFVDEFHWDAIR